MKAGLTLALLAVTFAFPVPDVAPKNFTDAVYDFTGGFVDGLQWYREKTACYNQTSELFNDVAYEIVEGYAAYFGNEHAVFNTIQGAYALLEQSKEVNKSCNLTTLVHELEKITGPDFTTFIYARVMWNLYSLIKDGTHLYFHEDMRVKGQATGDILKRMLEWGL
jgi:hypothetical protein